MGKLKVNKLNHLLTSWPSGTVSACSWLHDKGYGYDLINKYRTGKWLNSIGRGAVARCGDSVNWMGGIFAIQEQLGLSIHPGAKTALEIFGYSQFVYLGKGRQVYFIGKPPEKLPVWFKHHDWEIKIYYTTPNLFVPEKGIGLTKKDMGTFSITVSAPERAILELLHLVPKPQEFEEARSIMETLTSLRPRILQSLLESCRSIKVKRLFLFLAEECGHPWFKELNLSKIDLGKGKRMLKKGGYFDSKYQISIPGRRPLKAQEGEK